MDTSEVGPWTKYQQSSAATGGEAGPWTKYQSRSAALPPAPTSGAIPTNTPIPKGLQGDPSTAFKIAEPIEETIKGAGKGLMNTAQTTGHLLAPKGSFFDTPDAVDATPRNTAQKIGYYGEQAGEYFVPGLGEEDAAAHAPSLINTARAMGKSAVTTGIHNKMQGGDFTTGAAMGAGGEALNAAGKAIAPKLAESALNIGGRGGKQRGFGKTPGRAILDDTEGVNAGTIEQSARKKIGSLGEELESAADRAASKYEKHPPIIKGSLPEPKNEIPLGEAPEPQAGPSQLIDAERLPQENVGEARVIRNAKGQILAKKARIYEYPESRPPRSIPNGQTVFNYDEEGFPRGPEGPVERPLLPFGRAPNGQILSREPTRAAYSTSGVTEPEILPPHSGPGVLLRGSSEPPLRPGQSAPRPGTYNVPRSLNPGAPSTRPALSILDQAERTATAEHNAPQLRIIQNLRRTLTEEPQESKFAGQKIPTEQLPREILNAKRGIQALERSWNPEERGVGKGLVRQISRALDEELDRTVPESKDLNQRMSSLYEVKKNAGRVSRGESIPGKVIHRVAAHTGALAGASYGAYEGHKQGGFLGGLAGGTAGLIIPELLAHPTTSMVAARALNGKVGSAAIRGAGAGLLQSNRKKNQANQ